MILYLSIIFVAMAIIATFNIIFTSASVWFIILAVVVTTAFQFVIDGVFAIIINKMPNKWFAMDNKHYHVSKRAQEFYEKLKIRKWKDKVWELGGLGGFRKNKLATPNNAEYIERFIVESHKGILTHRIGYFVGFLGIFIFPLKYALVIGLPIAIVNLILNILPVMILRYNIPKLKLLHKRLKRNEEMKEQKDIA